MAKASVSLKQYLINLELDAYCLPKLTVYFFSSSYMYVWQFLENLLGRIKMYKIHVYTQQLLFQFLLQARVV